MTARVFPLLLAVVLLADTAIESDAFQSLQHPSSRQQLCNTQLFMAKAKKGQKGGKGFGEAAPAAPTASKKSSSSESFTPVATTPTSKAQPTGILQASEPEDTPLVVTEGAQADMSQGKRALEQMRRQQAEKKDAELRRVREIRQTDKLVQTEREAAAIPEKVAMRMGQRMLPFVGIPLFGSLAAFVAFWYLATYKNLEFEPAAVATTTIVILVSGLLVRLCFFLLLNFRSMFITFVFVFDSSHFCAVKSHRLLHKINEKKQGITYSIVSASWDEDREGSFLGIEEFQKNVGNIKEGLDRSKENMVLREKMAGLPEAEIEAAIADLERREKRQQSFENKISQELEK